VRLMVPAAVEHLSRGRGHALRISTFCDLDHVDRWKAVAASLMRGLSYRTSQMLSALGVPAAFDRCAVGTTRGACCLRVHPSQA
jgi:hypothetical protein